MILVSSGMVCRDKKWYFEIVVKSPNQLSMNNKLLTVSEAAAFAGISTKAIYAAIASQRLARRYRQGSLVVRESDMAAWNATRKKNGRPPGQAMSPEHKAKIAAAQKRRWAERRKNS